MVGETLTARLLPHTLPIMDKLRKFITSSRFVGTVISVIAIAAIAFIYFYPDAAQGNQLRQHDMQQGTAIGQEAKLFHEATAKLPAGQTHSSPECPHSRFHRRTPPTPCSPG